MIQEGFRLLFNIDLIFYFSGYGLRARKAAQTSRIFTRLWARNRGLTALQKGTRDARGHGGCGRLRCGRVGRSKGILNLAQV